tara:strand:- start:26 stop:478 length:453 start_codon:yes stop_codon:yes gene_type:complete
MNIDYFMNEAISEAKKALNSNEVPVGGIIVENKSQKILSQGHNLTNSLNSAIHHCEILLINEACKKLNSKYLVNCTLFISLEPCIMCAAAISEVHIERVYFAAYDEKYGGLEKLLTFYKKNKNFLPEIYGGIHEKQSSLLLKQFFEKKRS